ncbi:MAG: exodeoxyribonuclease III [Candidatus Tantalella remota]|nr:exodeoxyribonuclease III [Candidatus Tantalella remota]
MRLISWNVNGIRAIKGKGFLEWFEKESPDILCVQETKALPEQLDTDLLEPDGYKTYWNNPNRKGYAGVAVFSKKEPLSVETDFSSGRLDTEGRCLTLHFKDFVLKTCYFPNGGGSPERLKYKLDFYKKFLKHVDGIKNRNIIICGDVNTAHKEIDLARPKQNEMFSGFLPEERAWMDKFVCHGYVDTFRECCAEGENYSWWDYKTRSRERNVGWRIDYFFITEKLKGRLKDAFIMTDVFGSDHCPVGIEIAL